MTGWKSSWLGMLAPTTPRSVSRLWAIHESGSSTYRTRAISRRPAKPVSVAGSPAMNFGAQLAQGQWIAPLDHDDEFVPNHIEALLVASRRRALELTYGRFLAITPEGHDNYEIARFLHAFMSLGFKRQFHPTALRFFEYNPKSWMLNEPGDWNLCRRMLKLASAWARLTRSLPTTIPHS